MSLQVLKIEMKQRQQDLHIVVGEAIAVQKHLKILNDELEELSSNIQTSGKALAILQELSGSVQGQFIATIENLVTEGLTSVFGEVIKFVITPSIRNRQVNMDFSLVNADGTTTDVLDARGGGLVALCGVLLRIVMVRLMRDRVRQILILDEPFSHLSSEFLPVAADLLKRLSEELDIQILMVSHQTEFLEVADKSYRLYKTAEGTKAEILR